MNVIVPMKYILASMALSVAVLAQAQSSSFFNIAGDIAKSSAAYSSEMARLAADEEATRAENTLENPEVEFEHLWSAGPSENKWNAGVSQAFDWPGAYRARRRAADALANARSISLTGAFQALEQRAAQLMVELIAVKHKIGILGEVHASMEQLSEQYNRAWKAGETTILDVNKMKIGTVRSASELAQAREEQRLIEAELSAMAPDAAATADALELTDFPYMELRPLDAYMQLVEVSPEVRYQNALADAENANAAVARMQRMPGFSLGYVHAFEEGTHFNGLSVGLSLPIYSRKHSVASAQLAAQAARFGQSSVRYELERKVMAGHASAVALGKQMAEFAPVVEGVDNLALLRKALDGGELSLLDYLQETGFFLRARLDYLDISRQYAQQLVYLTSLGLF